MITISEVIEQCALEVEPSEDHRNNPNDYIGGEETMELLATLAAAIRALAAQYEGCIVAEREAVAWQYRDDPWYDGNKWHELFSLTKDVCLARWKGIGDEVPLYRAKEPTK